MPSANLADIILQAAKTRQLPQAQPMRRADQAFQNRDLHNSMWTSPGVSPPKVDHAVPLDDQLFKIPTQQMEEVGEDPQNHLFVTGSPPMWTEPPYWSHPLEERFTACVPTWEEEYTMGTLKIPEDKMAIIQDVSYHVTSGLAQFDLFEFVMYDGARRAVWEDMIIDPLVAAPARRYVFGGDTIPLPLTERVDSNRTLRFTVKARGIVTLAGVSNHNPGDPLIPNANFRLLVYGYYAPLRHNVDGAPRQSDMGNMEFIPQNEDLYLEGR